MATSISSDEISLDHKYLEISSSSDSASRSSLYRGKCPLCYKYRKTFTCKDCILSGSFCNSKSKATESFRDKQRDLQTLQLLKAQAQVRCKPYLNERSTENVLQTNIKRFKERNHLLKLALEEKKKKIGEDRQNLIKLQVCNKTRTLNLPKYKKKVEQMENYLEKLKDDVQQKRENIQKNEVDIKRLSKLRIKQLFKYIFPISKVTPTIEMDCSEPDMVSALAEASQCNYYSGGEFVDFSGEMKYVIVCPALPGSGNYAAYNEWVAQNKKKQEEDVLPNQTSSLVSIQNNPAYSISAALMYTSQLLSVLSFFLDVRLPFRMVFSDFCSCMMNKQQFERRVARLNANILHLCFTQNVDLTALRPQETIHNLLQLLENKKTDLGRQGPLELDRAKASALEKPFSKNLQISVDSDDEGDLHGEWEAIPHVQLPEAPAGAVVQSTQNISTQASMMAGGLINSAAANIASIWRGFTRR